MKNLNEQIDRFIFDELSEEEERAFNIALEDSQELKKKVIIRKKILSGVQAYQRKSLIKQFEEEVPFENPGNDKGADGGEKNHFKDLFQSSISVKSALLYVSLTIFILVGIIIWKNIQTRVYLEEIEQLEKEVELNQKGDLEEFEKEVLRALRLDSMIDQFTYGPIHYEIENRANNEETEALNSLRQRMYSLESALTDEYAYEYLSEMIIHPNDEGHPYYRYGMEDFLRYMIRRTTEGEDSIGLKVISELLALSTGIESIRNRIDTAENRVYKSRRELDTLFQEFESLKGQGLDNNTNENKRKKVTDNDSPPEIKNYEKISFSDKQAIINLNVPPTGPEKYWERSDNKKNEKYGYLYSWDAAKNVCPEGWSLPTKEEWKEILSQYGGVRSSMSDPEDTGRSTFKRISNSGIGIKLGGEISPDTENKKNSIIEAIGVGEYGYYWTDSEYSSDMVWVVSFNKDKTRLIPKYKTSGLSCICVK